MFAAQVADGAIDDVEQCATAECHRYRKVLRGVRKRRESKRIARILLQRHVVVEDRIGVATQQRFHGFGHRGQIANLRSWEPAGNDTRRKRIGDHCDVSSPFLCRLW